ncbi:calcium-binding protein [Citrobacter koseri]|uniref:calcium-binding protein n=1 Tax=Citrobacter koseri TaxID=545 RepID=UPI0028BE9E48|nr:calcium-binding protein [Citrobacter koseri]MDT7487287.1 calcium-binding protein [Citrobacter koseri]
MIIMEGDNNSNYMSATQSANMLGYGGNDEMHGSYDYDIMDGGTGNDVLYGNGGNDVVIGGAGTDRLYGGDGDDLVVGDNLSSATGAGNDTLDGGAGNDRLYGNYGDDLYLYSVNSGIDTINDGHTAGSGVGYGGGNDTIQFTDTTVDDIFYQHLEGSNDLFLYTSAGIGDDGSINHGVIIQDFYANDENTNIEYLADSTGALYDLSGLLNLDDASYGESFAHSLGLA